MDINQSDEHCGNETRAWDKIIGAFLSPCMKKFRKAMLFCMGINCSHVFFQWDFAAVPMKVGGHFFCLNLAWTNDVLDQ